jgi:hypothetical protein
MGDGVTVTGAKLPLTAVPVNFRPEIPFSPVNSMIAELMVGDPKPSVGVIVKASDTVTLAARAGEEHAKLTSSPKAAVNKNERFIIEIS